MPTDEEKEEIEEFQNNFFELLREFDAEGGANAVFTFGGLLSMGDARSNQQRNRRGGRG